MTSFSQTLQALRASAKLTNHELARLADVPASLISGLQHDNRRVGEYQARKIGTALRLSGDALEQFIYDAISGCTEKVLNEAKQYPAQLLNLLAVQLSRAGIPADSIQHFNILGDEHSHDINFTLGSGKTATLRTQLVCA
jgi:hypothetical protein